MLPAADRVGLALAQKDQSAFRIRIFEQNLNLRARGHILRAVELIGVHHAFALQTHLDDDVVADLRDDRPLENAAGQAGIHFLLENLLQILAFPVAEQLVDLLLQLLFGQS